MLQKTVKKTEKNANYRRSDLKNFLLAILLERNNDPCFSELKIPSSQNKKKIPIVSSI